VADHSAPSGAAVIREAAALGRFGYRAEVLVDSVLAPSIRRYVPARQIHVMEGAFDPRVFPSVELIAVATGPGTLGKVALGIADGIPEQAALWALGSGVRTFMDLTCPADCEQEALRAVYSAHAEKLRALGVEHAARGMLLLALLAGLGAATEIIEQTGRQRPGYGGPQRVFITVKDVQAHRGGAWVIPANAVVTAAAGELALRKKIVFQRGKE